MQPGKQMPADAQAESLATSPDATGFSGEETAPQKSWVIWFNDGRYSYAWGETPDAALTSWLENFKRGVRIMVAGGAYKSALPVSQYLREMNGQV